MSLFPLNIQPIGLFFLACQQSAPREPAINQTSNKAKRQETKTTKNSHQFVTAACQKKYNFLRKNTLGYVDEESC